MERPLLEVNHVEISYSNTIVVKDFSISLGKGEILGIVGESGSGKSTVIKGIMGILGKAGVITNGDILFRGININGYSDKAMRKLRGSSMGMIFQNSEAALCPIRTVGDQLFESVSQHKKISKAQMESEALEIMEKMNLEDGEQILNSYPFEMSRGMNQRVGIMMAMIMKPALLLADEPTSSLDVTVQAQVVKEMMKLREVYNTSIIIVTHNIGVVSHMADKIVVMHRGDLIECGKTQEVIHSPKMEYTKELLASVPRICKE